jgi:uncharacterized protein
MKLKRFNNAENFLNSIEAYLRKSEVENNIMLGVCTNLKNKKELDKDDYFAVVEETGEAKLAAMMTPPNNLTLYTEEKNFCEAIELVADNLIEEGWTVSGIVTSNEMSKAFADLWASKINCDIRKGMNMRIYELRKVNPPKNNSGKLRIATLKDLPLVQQWTYEMSAQIGEHQTKEYCFELAEKKLKDEYVYLWEDDGKVVSMAAKARPTETGVVVNLVYTPEEFRNKGYASSCVAALSQLLLDLGHSYCSLFTDLSNPISNSIYMKMGYKSICDMDEYKFVNRGINHG